MAALSQLPTGLVFYEWLMGRMEDKGLTKREEDFYLCSNFAQLAGADLATVQYSILIEDKPSQG